MIFAPLPSGGYLERQALCRSPEGDGCRSRGLPQEACSKTVLIHRDLFPHEPQGKVSQDLLLSLELTGYETDLSLHNSSHQTPALVKVERGCALPSPGPPLGRPSCAGHPSLCCSHQPASCRPRFLLTPTEAPEKNVEGRLAPPCPTLVLYGVFL